jgi:hypothetical protein
MQSLVCIAAQRNCWYRGLQSEAVPQLYCSPLGKASRWGGTVCNILALTISKDIWGVGKCLGVGHACSSKANQHTWTRQAAPQPQSTMHCREVHMYYVCTSLQCNVHCGGVQRPFCALYSSYLKQQSIRGQRHATDLGGASSSSSSSSSTEGVYQVCCNSACWLEPACRAHLRKWLMIRCPQGRWLPGSPSPAQKSNTNNSHYDV